MTGIHEHTNLDEFFDKIGHSSGIKGVVRACRRIVYGEPCGPLILTSENPRIACTECELCGRLAALCTGCSVLREDDTCVEFEPLCRFSLLHR
jgi:hypothetical protein